MIGRRLTAGILCISKRCKLRLLGKHDLLALVAVEDVEGRNMLYYPWENVKVDAHWHHDRQIQSVYFFHNVLRYKPPTIFSVRYVIGGIRASGTHVMMSHIGLHLLCVRECVRGCVRECIRV
jgi:hypothetical protein